MLGAVVTLPLATGFELLQPYLLKTAIDEHIAVGRPDGLGRLGLYYLLALLGQYSAGSIQLYFTQVAGQRAMNDLRAQLYRHVMSLAQAFFDRTPVGRLMTRMTNDIESLTEMFASGLVSLVGDIVKLTFILVTIFALDWRLALFSMASAPVLFGIAAVFRRLVRDAFREVRTKLARMNGFLQEHLSGMKVVQAFAQEQLVERRFDVANREYRTANARAITADAALYAIVEAVGAFALAGLLWHGGGRIWAGTLTFGVLVAFIEYLAKFFGPIRDLSTKYTVMQQAMAAAERVFGLLDTRELDAPVAASAAVARPGEGRAHLQLADVSFGYRDLAPVLSGLSLAVPRGQTVAIVGPSGAGKSTLIKLVARLYEPGAGHILIDGRDVRDLPVEELRRRVVVVPQDPFLFAGTLAENIGLGAEAVTEEQIAAALQRVGGANLLARPGGLGAVVIERGANLSLGERQLIAFARALARDPEILILDEATASVDPDTERLIERGIAELLRGRTSLVIAHRFSTIGRADRIVVVDGGRIAEEGQHDGLLAADGLYAKLYKLQAAS